MKIEIGNKNKVENSNIGSDNTINKEDNSKKIIVDILVGLFVTIVGGIILYFITK